MKLLEIDMPNGEDRIDEVLNHFYKSEDCLDLKMSILSKNEIISRRALYITSELGIKCCSCLSAILKNVNHPHEKARLFVLSSIFDCINYLNSSDICVLFSMFDDVSDLVKGSLISLLSKIDANLIFEGAKLFLAYNKLDLDAELLFTPAIVDEIIQMLNKSNRFILFLGYVFLLKFHLSGEDISSVLELCDVPKIVRELLFA
ncbi:hypothetical protein PQU94_03680 [Asticcacaulis sp. DXS10W]|uniref:Uncharacterized protein n=1 Tax=Asticcacaulis currens TaxID=2984210 RepID=A0ABT5IB20_9CAUL|nr:hypothetical protein [Asticcacaulis currens]MDC7693381.1 hypothetical protein [Asticcacaulis currens]